MRATPARSLISLLVAVPLVSAWPTMAPGAVLAQEACRPEAEPNDTEVDLPEAALQGPICIEAELPPDDQDLFLWEVTDALASTGWDLTLEGVTGTLTVLQAFPVETPPGQQPVVTRRTPILDLSVPPDSTEAATRSGVFMPIGRYLIGVTRSGEPGGGEPSVTAYRVRIEPTTLAPAATELEPNDDDVTATPVRGTFEIAGDLAGSNDVFGWTVDEPGLLWDVEVQVPIEARVTLDVTAADGRHLGNVADESMARLHDLALVPGRHVIRLSPSSDAPRPYVLRATPTDAGGDPEPNDETALAIPIGDGQPAKGRLATVGDRDRYRLSVPPGDRSLRDVRLLWRSDAERRLCLLDTADQPVTCRSGVRGAALPALSLSPGQHILEVSGRADPGDIYALRVDVAGPAPADFEAEPNDDVASATSFDPAMGMRGRGEPLDVDVYRMEVDGEPQLWQVDLSGADVDALAWIRPLGTDLQRASVASDGSAATLSDLYLVPGEHWFSVRVDGPGYALSATALGPPDPDAEREPNGDRVLAESYRIGERKIGRLPTQGDVDVYRFTLAAPGHVRFTLTQPDDGAIDLRLRHGDDLISQRVEPEVGSTITWDLQLQPGDHLLELRPSTLSEGRYELTSERLDPFALAHDQEPNDDVAWVRPAPASLSWAGDAVGRGDQDWYRLPALTESEPLRIELDDPNAGARLTAAGGQLAFVREGDGVFVATHAPLGMPLDLAVVSYGPYHVDVSGGGLTPVPEPAALALDVSWEIPDAPVAAYWTEAQRVEGGLRLTNTSSQPLDAHLETATSHYLWSASLAETDVSVGPGESVVVPASVDIAADAWADEAVLVSAHAVTDDGAEASGSVELVATADGPPTGTYPGWPLPDELLGGLNAAYAGFGAVPGNDVNATWEPALFDGVAPAGGGFADLVELPVDLWVDLAGDEAIPVAGIILNPLARNGRLSDVPSRFELWLSPDGVDWRPTLEGLLSPLPIEQAFVLHEPQDARFARLRILSTYGNGPGYVALGEWKVIAAPGVPLTSESLNVADPTLGGHLVTTVPFSGEQGLGSRLLGAETRRETLRLDEGPGVDIIVGFQEGRAARIERLEWLDPDGSNPAVRLEHVDVWVSTQTPLGPWTLLGTWPLVRSSDGAVASFEVPDHTWARYVRLTGQALPESREVELPGTLRVIESPTDETYRSIVGEWGAESSDGLFELLVAPESIEWDPAFDAADGPAEAAPLAPAVEVVDRVQIDVDEDWYAIDVPLGMSGLEIVVDGRPTVGVALSLFDDAGGERPMAFVRQADGSVRYQARVEPGERYRLRVRQPPFSSVFAFDTSGSIGPFLDIVMQGMRTFAAEVRPGREAVMIVPFEDPPLLPDWQDDPYLLQDAVNNIVGVASSSGAEAGLLDAAILLEEREGARAVLLVTDAVTSTFRLGGELWDELAVARPMVFAVHIGAAESPLETRELMQDWAASGGGHYTYPSTHGEMDRAFDRMATWLRRPAVYSLGYETVNLDPGSISVVGPADGGVVAIAPGVGIEIILDTSASMRSRLEGRTRIAIAKESLDLLVDEALPEGVPIALRAFGGKRDTKKARCQTRLVQQLEPLDRAAMRRQIDELPATRRTATPIAAALAKVVDDLRDVTGTRSIVLVTDGNETCDGDPAAEIAALREAGVDVTVNIVGFALEEEELKERMAEWADVGGGRYFDAAGAYELLSAIGAALGAPIRVYGPDGKVHEGGTVGGGPIQIDPGTYRVEVLSDPPVGFEEVVVGGGAWIVLELPAAE